MFASNPVGAVLLAAGLLGGLAVAGCAVRTGVAYRAYDPYYSDFHVWDDVEAGYYHRWARDTHRDPHREFRHLSDNDRHEYFEWRHNHR